MFVFYKELIFKTVKQTQKQHNKCCEEKKCQQNRKLNVFAFFGYQGKLRKIKMLLNHEEED